MFNAPINAAPTYLIQLKSKIQGVVSKQPVRVSLYFKRLGSSDTVGIDARAIYNPASVIKLPVLLAVFQSIQDGRLHLDQKLQISPHHLRAGSGVLGKGDLWAYFSIRDYLKMMISLSDNTATAVLMDHLGVDYIQAVCLQFGLKDTKIGTSNLLAADGINMSSAYDMGVLLEGMMAKGWVDKQYLSFIRGILIQQKYQWGLPYLLPKTAQVAHKTGSLRHESHDVGIIQYGDVTYVVAIFSYAPDSYLQSRPLIAELSKLIWDQVTEQ